MKISELFVFDAAQGRTPVESATAGDIVVFAGVTDFDLGNELLDSVGMECNLGVRDYTVRMSESSYELEVMSPLRAQERIIPSRCRCYTRRASYLTFGTNTLCSELRKQCDSRLGSRRAASCMCTKCLGMEITNCAVAAR